MKKFSKQLFRLIMAMIIFLAANTLTLSQYMGPVPLVIAWLLFIICNFIPSIHNRFLKSRRLRVCGNGCELLELFLISTIVSVVFTITGYLGILPGFANIVDAPKHWLLHTLIVFMTEAVIFWNGIIRVYLTSVQLGIRIRVIGIFCGMIPIANLIALGIIINTASKEVAFENEKILLNESRQKEQICKTKYPFLLVHGVFFRDFRYLNYWGRIPAELEKNGATIFYGNHPSAASVENSAQILADRIEEIVEQTGCEKVNIIAHSKGGLDCRYAIGQLGISDKVASLTTINSPHQGCEFADYLLSKIPSKQQSVVAGTYNAALRKLGEDPNFLEAVSDLTAAACQTRNETITDAENVYYQSIGSQLNHAHSGKFPLNFTYRLVHYFDGSNDGLVGENSFRLGKYRHLTVSGKRGISHADVIDLNRENIPNFDVREFYVQLVSDLREMGY